MHEAVHAGRAVSWQVPTVPLLCLPAGETGPGRPNAPAVTRTGWKDIASRSRKHPEGRETLAASSSHTGPRQRARPCVAAVIGTQHEVPGASTVQLGQRHNKEPHRGNTHPAPGPRLHFCVPSGKGLTEPHRRGAGVRARMNCGNLGHSVQARRACLRDCRSGRGTCALGTGRQYACTHGLAAGRICVVLLPLPCPNAGPRI